MFICNIYYFWIVDLFNGLVILNNIFFCFEYLNNQLITSTLDLFFKSLLKETIESK